MIDAHEPSRALHVHRRDCKSKRNRDVELIELPRRRSLVGCAGLAAALRFRRNAQIAIEPVSIRDGRDESRFEVSRDSVSILTITVAGLRSGADLGEKCDARKSRNAQPKIVVHSCISLSDLGFPKRARLGRLPFAGDGL